MKYEQHTDNEAGMAGEAIAVLRPNRTDYHSGLNIHGGRPMPCQFTEDELDEIVIRSKAGKFIPHDEVMKI